MQIAEKMKLLFANVSKFISGKNPCNFCQKNPVQSQKSLDLVKAAGGMYEPTPSPLHDIFGNDKFKG